jgi:putative iron-dependent peroxidase
VRSAYDVIFESARSAIAMLSGLASVAEETSSWLYQHDRDLTGFIDGTENPTLAQAPDIVLIPEGEPGGGGTILLLQKWEHNAAAWESLNAEEQGRVIGRRKLDSDELDPSRTTRTSPAPTRTRLERSSAATCPTAR